MTMRKTYLEKGLNKLWWLVGHINQDTYVVTDGKDLHPVDTITGRSATVPNVEFISMNEVAVIGFTQWLVKEIAADNLLELKNALAPGHSESQYLNHATEAAWRSWNAALEYSISSHQFSSSPRSEK